MAQIPGSLQSLIDILASVGQDTAAWGVTGVDYLGDAFTGKDTSISRSMEKGREKTKGLDYKPGPEGQKVNQELLQAVAGMLAAVKAGIPDVLEPGAKRSVQAIGEAWNKLPKELQAGIEFAAATPVLPTSKVKKGKAVSKLFEDVTDVDEATRLAQQGKHLQRNKAGKYIGGPESITSPQALGAQRKKVDQLVQQGEFGMDWYDRARKTGEDFAPLSPEMQNLFARGSASYSPQATPDTEIAHFLKQHNTKVLTGQDVFPRTKSQGKKVAKAYVPDGSGGQEIFGDRIKLGEKTGPYADAKNPTIPEADLYKTANDIWHGRVMGYGEDFSRGFSPQEHGYLTGENLLAADRANAADLTAGITRDAHWNPRSVQAATWSAQREKSYIEKAIAKHEKSNLKRKKPIPIDMEKITREAKDYAKRGIDDAANRSSAYITSEVRTGDSVGHLNMADDEKALIQDYTDRVRTAIPRDPVLDPLQVYSKSAEPNQGFYTNQAGRMEQNPGFTHQALVGSDFTGSPPRTLPADNAALDYSTLLGAIMRGQEAGAHSRFFPQGMGKQKVEDMNAAMFQHGPLDQGGIDRLKEIASSANASPVNYGDKTLLARFGDEGPIAGTTNELVNAIARSGMTGDVRRGTAQTGYLDTGLSAGEGSGVATRKLLQAGKDADKLIPGIESRTAASVGNQAKIMNEIDTAIANETGKAVRQDLMKLRDILSSGGVPALREWIKKNGYAGLPTALLGALGLGAIASEQESPGVQ